MAFDIKDITLSNHESLSHTDLKKIYDDLKTWFDFSKLIKHKSTLEEVFPWIFNFDKDSVNLSDKIVSRLVAKWILKKDWNLDESWLNTLKKDLSTKPGLDMSISTFLVDLMKVVYYRNQFKADFWKLYREVQPVMPSWGYVSIPKGEKWWDSYIRDIEQSEEEQLVIDNNKLNASIEMFWTQAKKANYLNIILSYMLNSVNDSKSLSHSEKQIYVNDINSISRKLEKSIAKNWYESPETEKILMELFFMKKKWWKNSVNILPNPSGLWEVIGIFKKSVFSESDEISILQYIRKDLDQSQQVSELLWNDISGSVITDKQIISDLNSWLIWWVDLFKDYISDESKIYDLIKKWLFDKDPLKLWTWDKIKYDELALSISKDVKNSRAAVRNNIDSTLSDYQTVIANINRDKSASIEEKQKFVQQVNSNFKKDVLSINWSTIIINSNAASALGWYMQGRYLVWQIKEWIMSVNYKVNESLFNIDGSKYSMYKDIHGYGWFDVADESYKLWKEAVKEYSIDAALLLLPFAWELAWAKWISPAIAWARWFELVMTTRMGKVWSLSELWAWYEVWKSTNTIAKLWVSRAWLAVWETALTEWVFAARFTWLQALTAASINFSANALDIDLNKVDVWFKQFFHNWLAFSVTRIVSKMVDAWFAMKTWAKPDSMKEKLSNWMDWHRWVVFSWEILTQAVALMSLNEWTIPFIDFRWIVPELNFEWDWWTFAEFVQAMAMWAISTMARWNHFPKTRTDWDAKESLASNKLWIIDWFRKLTAKKTQSWNVMLLLWEREVSLAWWWKLTVTKDGLYVFKEWDKSVVFKSYTDFKSKLSEIESKFGKAKVDELQAAIVSTFTKSEHLIAYLQRQKDPISIKIWKDEFKVTVWGKENKDIIFLKKNKKWELEEVTPSEYINLLIHLESKQWQSIARKLEWDLKTVIAELEKSKLEEATKAAEFAKTGAKKAWEAILNSGKWWLGKLKEKWLTVTDWTILRRDLLEWLGKLRKWQITQIDWTKVVLPWHWTKEWSSFRTINPLKLTWALLDRATPTNALIWWPVINSALKWEDIDKNELLTDAIMYSVPGRVWWLGYFIVNDLWDNMERLWIKWKDAIDLYQSATSAFLWFFTWDAKQKAKDLILQWIDPNAPDALKDWVLKLM